MPDIQTNPIPTTSIPSKKSGLGSQGMEAGQAPGGMASGHLGSQQQHGLGTQSGMHGTSQEACAQKHACQSGECSQQMGSHVHCSSGKGVSSDHSKHNVCHLVKESADILLKHQRTIGAGEVIDVEFPLTMLSKSNQVERVDLRNLIANKKVVLFGNPGAFTTVCSSKHIPEWARAAQEYQKMGIDHVICVNTNDPFVNAMWSKDMNVTTNEIMLLSDTDKAFLMSLGMLQHLPSLGVCPRRFSMFLDSGRVMILNVDELGGESYKFSGPAYMKEKIEELSRAGIQNVPGLQSGVQGSQQQHSQQHIPTV